MTTGTAIAVFLAVLLAANNADAYSKYGRTCKDIGCLSSEVCVMAEDPCSINRRDACGSYPTCKKTSGPAAGGRKPHDRPYVPLPKPVTPRPTPPTPPPRSSSYGGRFSGGRNSIFDRIFGGDSRRTTPNTWGGGSKFYDRTTSKPYAHQPGGRGYYDSKKTSDGKGNVEWRFSG